MRHFFLEIEPGTVPDVGETVILDREESHHLGTVLRSGREHFVILTDGRGHRFEARLLAQEKRAASLEILSVIKDEDELREPRLTLAIALLKPKRFEWALEKAVELGVHHIVPLISEHVDQEKGGRKNKRWLPIMRTAIKQCGRSYLPGLSEPMEVETFLADPPAGVTVFGAIPEEIGVQGEPLSLIEVSRHRPEPLPENLTALIGPEGGWSENEVGLFCRQGLQPISLGPHILRAETAAAAVLAGLQQIRQQWSR